MKENKIKVGEVYKTNKNGNIEILEQITGTFRFKVKFLNTGIEKVVTRQGILNGDICDIYAKDLVLNIGDVFESNNFGKAEIVDIYFDFKNHQNDGVLVKFLNTGNLQKINRCALLGGYFEDKNYIDQIKDFYSLIYKNSKRQKYRILSKDNGKYNIEFLNSKNNYRYEKREVFSGNVSDDIAEENDFLNSKWEQICGDILEVIERSDKKSISNNSYYKYKFLKYNFVGEALKSDIVNGVVGNPNYPSVQGIGYIGVGEYNSVNSKEIYKTWCHILDRCYNQKCQRYSTYGAKGITVCENWYNFQNFAKWYIENSKWNTNNYILEIDKDILCNIINKNTKIYSPETCLLIPQELNGFLTCDNLRSGVYENKNSFRSEFRYKGQRIVLGTFDTFEKAKSTYAKYKSKIWKEIVQNYNLSKELHSILINYNFNWGLNSL